MYAYPKTAIVVLTHFLDQNILEIFHRIRAETNEHYNVFLALNQVDTELNVPKEAESVREKLFLCNHATLLRLPYPEKCKPEGWSGKRWMSVDNVDTILLSFYQEHPEYASYWGIEYDVHYQGKWGFLFDRFAGSHADLLGTMLDKASKVPIKALIPPFVDAGGKPIDYNDAIAGFFPIHRLSNRFLRTLDEDYRKGWSGHYELTWGTTAKRHGLEIEDIGGNGPYTKPHNKNVFYFNTIGRWDKSPGTFVFRPAFSKIQPHENTLWHPLKPAGNYFNHIATLHEQGISEWIRYMLKRVSYGSVIWLWFRMRWRPASSSPVPPQETQPHDRTT